MAFPRLRSKPAWRGSRTVGVDGGSTDPGPYHLGSGKCVSRMAMKRDLRLMLRAARAQRIPLIIGSSGGAGGRPASNRNGDRSEIARNCLHFRLAIIHSDRTGIGSSSSSNPVASRLCAM
jgi:hypothetical protein